MSPNTAGRWTRVSTRLVASFSLIALGLIHPLLLGLVSCVVLPEACDGANHPHLFDNRDTPALNQSSLVILHGGTVFAPEELGEYDVLFSNPRAIGKSESLVERLRQPWATRGTILSLVPRRSDKELFEWRDALSGPHGETTVRLVNVTGLSVVPGIVDMHEHPIGGGGELGPISRTPAAQAATIARAGVTTLVGCLGTDGVSRSLKDLHQKLLALDQLGFTTFMWTGNYRFPIKTLFDNVQEDIVLVQKIIGIGEVAASDHRGSWISPQDMKQIVSDARVGGLLSGKAGVAYFHMGNDPAALEPLWEVVNTTTIPITNLIPTHMGDRGERLIDDGARWIRAGGFVDFTADAPGAGENTTIGAILDYVDMGLDLSHISISSDAFGSFPFFDSNGVVQRYGVGSPDSLLFVVRALALDHGWGLDRALRVATSSPASMLKLDRKGTIAQNNDADLIVLDERLEPVFVFAGGVPMVTPWTTVKGLFPCT